MNNFIILLLLILPACTNGQKHSGNNDTIPPPIPPISNHRANFVNASDSLNFGKSIHVLQDHLNVKDSLIFLIENQLLDTFSNKRLKISNYKVDVLLNKFIKLDYIRCLQFAINNFNIQNKIPPNSNDDVLSYYPFLGFISNNYSPLLYLDYLIKDSRFINCDFYSAKLDRDLLILNQVIIEKISYDIDPQFSRESLFNIVNYLDLHISTLKNQDNCLYQNILKLRNWLHNYYESHKN